MMSKERMVHVTIRLPERVVTFYKDKSSSYTSAIREALWADYVMSTEAPLTEADQMRKAYAESKE